MDFSWSSNEINDVGALITASADLSHAVIFQRLSNGPNPVASLEAWQQGHEGALEPVSGRQSDPDCAV
jgi:hypothetical protein